MASAALLLPTVVASFIRSTVVYQFDAGASSMFRPDVWNLALTAVTDGYFLVVVALLARTVRARVTAVLLGLVATALDLATLALVYYTDYRGVTQWISNVGSGVALVSFVAAWGVARRCRPAWILGMIPTVLIAVLITLCYQLQWTTELLAEWLLRWYVGWGLWVGAFVLGCLCCWACEAWWPTRPRPSGPAGPEGAVDGRSRTE